MGSVAKRKLSPTNGPNWILLALDILLRKGVWIVLELESGPNLPLVSVSCSGSKKENVYSLSLSPWECMWPVKDVTFSRSVFVCSGLLTSLLFREELRRAILISECSLERMDGVYHPHSLVPWWLIHNSCPSKQDFSSEAKINSLSSSSFPKTEEWLSN